MSVTIDAAIDWSASSHDAVRAAHRWVIPERWNLGIAACDAHADGAGRTALVATDEAALAAGEAPRRVSFDELKALSDKAMSALVGLGVGRGGRVGVLLPQRLENAVAHLAAIKLGAVSVPLSPLFGADALVHRLGASEAKVLVTDAAGAASVATIRDRLPALGAVVCVGADAPAGVESFDRLLAADHPPVVAADTAADDPCMLIFTSGTSGLPRGVLHAHRFVPARLSAMELIHRVQSAPRDDDRPLYTPADWAWVGGLVDSVLTPWLFGRPVVAFARGAFCPERTFDLITATRARSLFLAPTAINRMRHVEDAAGRWPALRSVTVHTAGEPLGAATFAWAARTFGAVFELYGMTEVGAIVGSSPFVPPRAGALGKPYPGHDVVLLDEAGAELTGEGEGEIAVRRPDPGLFLGYWNDPEATAARFTGDLFHTGDWAHRGADGYLTYRGRRDDMFNTAGYRVGPTEIEGCLERHPAVQHAAVIGAPAGDDAEGGTIVKAFVQLAPGREPSEALADEIRRHVREALAAYQYPRRIVFARDLPMTVTGKIRRADLRADDADARFGAGEVY